MSEVIEEKVPTDITESVETTTYEVVVDKTKEELIEHIANMPGESLMDKFKNIPPDENGAITSLGETRTKNSDGKTTKIVLAKGAGVTAIETFIANFTEFDNLRKNSFKESLENVGVGVFQHHLLDMLESTQNESLSLQNNVKACAADFIRYLSEGLFNA